MTTPPEPPEQPDPTGPAGSAPDYGDHPAGGGAPDYGQVPPPSQPPAPPAPPAPPTWPPAPDAPTYPPAGAPAPPPYGGQFGAGTGATPPGAPVPPATPGAYGAYGAYGQPYAGAPELKPSKGMAVTALVLAFIACIPILPIVAIVLAVIVLRRGRDGRDHGKGLAIGALVVAPLTLLVFVGVVGAIVVAAHHLTTVDDLKTEQCFDGLKGDGTFGNLTVVDCGSPHDAQVLAVVRLTAPQAAAYPDDDVTGSRLCAQQIGDDARVRAYLRQPQLEPLLLTDREKPRGGDALACVVHRSDGAKITDSLADQAAPDGGTGTRSS